MVDEAHLPKLAEKNAVKWKDTSDMLHEEVRSLNKWILASLLSINGAAVLALLSSDQFSNSYKLSAGGLFILGLVLSIIFALFNGAILSKASQQAEAIAREFERISFGDEYKSDHFEKIEIRLKKLSFLEKAVNLISYISLALFIAGICILGSTFHD